MAEARAPYTTRRKPGPAAGSLPPRQSPGEKQFAFLWKCLAPGWVQPEREYRFDSEGGRRYRFDFCWPAAKVALECDGGQWKVGGGRHGGDSDKWKMNLAACQGWLVLTASPAMLRDEGSRVVEMVQQALSSREPRRETVPQAFSFRDALEAEAEETERRR